MLQEQVHTRLSGNSAKGSVVSAHPSEKDMDIGQGAFTTARYSFGSCQSHYAFGFAHMKKGFFGGKETA